MYLLNNSVAALLVSVISTIILTFIICHVLYSYHIHKNNLSKSLMIMAISTLLVFFMYSAIFIIISILDLLKAFNESDCIWYWMIDFILSVGKISMYLFFVFRLYLVFEDSLFALKYTHYKCFCLFIILSLLIPNIMITTWIILPINAIINSNSSFIITNSKDCTPLLKQYETQFIQKLAHYGIYSFVFFDILISIIILRLYLKKLLLLSMAYDSIIQSKSHRAATDKKSKTMSTNTIFMETAMKMFNLTVFAISTSYFAIFIHGLQLGLHWMCIDIVCNSLSIYLSFSFTKPIYKGFSIFCCDNCCFNGCVKFCICCVLQKNLPKDIKLMMNKKKNEKQVRNQINDSKHIKMSTISIPSTPNRTLQPSPPSFSKSNSSMFLLTNKLFVE